MSDEKDTSSTDRGLAWPFLTSETTPETPEPDLSSINSRISELPVEMQMEFERRSLTGLAVVEGVRETTREIDELDKRRLALGDVGGGVFKAAFVALLLGVLGHYFSSSFYFLALLVVALAASFHSEGLSSANNIDASRRACEARLKELKFRWMLSGFRLGAFAELSATIRNYAYTHDPCVDPVFREMWNRETMLINCNLRRKCGLPDHPDLPDSWVTDSWLDYV